MREFKVGDKVKIIEYGKWPQDFLGKSGVITIIDTESSDIPFYRVDFNVGFDYCHMNSLELVEETSDQSEWNLDINKYNISKGLSLNNNNNNVLELTERITEETLFEFMEMYGNYLAKRKLLQIIDPKISIDSAKDFYESEMRAAYGECA